jgi:hypothetical protein
MRLATIRRHWAIALILTAFLALAIAYNVATPLFEKPDEMWHYPYVKYLADGQGLPVQDLARTQSLMKQESTQPPLYYVTAALTTFWIEDDDWQDLVWLNPFWGYNAPGTVNDNKNRVLHTDRECFPYRGAVLAVRAARLVSVVWGAITVLATYLMALELSKGAKVLSGAKEQKQGSRETREQRSGHLFPKERGFAAGAATLVAFNPQFLFIASAVSNDSAVSALCTLALWLMLRLVMRGISTRRLVWLGVIAGLAILAKTSALALLPVAVVAIAMAACLQYSKGPGWAFLRGCMIVFGIVAIIAGWWYTINWRLHGDPLGVRIHQEIVGPGRPELTLAELIHELFQMELSFWAAFGWGNVHVSSWIYTLLQIGVRLGVLGLVILVIRNKANPSTGLRAGLTEQRITVSGGPLLLERNTRSGLALLLLWSLLIFVALLRWLQWIFAPAGRHLFPAISSIAILLLLGLLQFVPSQLRGKATALLAGAMLVFAIICPLAYIVPAYARPSLLSTEEIEAIPYRLDVNFGEVMKLLGYDLSLPNTQYPISNTITPGNAFTITLYWQSLADMNQDYAVFVHLLDENDLIIAQRNTFPGLGSFPTTLWRVGDAIADTYTLTLPETTYAPNSAQLEVGLFDFATGKRLRVYGPEGETVNDNVRFEEIEVLPRSEAGLPNPVHFNFGNRIALVGYDMGRRKAEPGATIHLTLYWQGLADMKDDYTVFVHLLREGDQIWAGADRQPQPPTSAWAKGQIVVDQYELVIAPDAPPDVYEMEVGLYLPKTGDRLDLLGQDGRLMGNRILLSKVRVE